jgi:hypothetical protein
VKLSKLAKQVLLFIDRQYPKAWEPSKSDEIIAKGERPLTTEDDLRMRFTGLRQAGLAEAVSTLIGYQFVAKVYLHAPDDFTEVAVAPGKTLRVPVAKPGAGVIAYQVTQAGKEAVAQFPSSKAKRVLSKLAAKGMEDYLLYALMFVFGLLVSSCLGIDLLGWLKKR